MISYRRLHRYKYQLTETYKYQTGIFLHTNCEIGKWICLHKNGVLTMFRGYSWDGASGATIDTYSTMRGSLVHDALYQLMRESIIDYREHRKTADIYMRDIMLEDGMRKMRARRFYWGVRTFGGRYAKPSSAALTP